MNYYSRGYSPATCDYEVVVVEMKDATTSTSKGNVTEGDAENTIENYRSKFIQRRHNSEAEYVSTNETASQTEGEADEQKAEWRAAAGIETKIENYENIRTQRRHYSEADYDEVKDVTTEEIESFSESPTEAYKNETARTKEAARVEKKKVEECEGVLSQRRHFPGSTTSNIFR